MVRACKLPKPLDNRSVKRDLETDETKARIGKFYQNLRTQECCSSVASFD